MANHEHPAPNPELISSALHAQGLLGQQAWRLTEEPIRQSRLLGVKVFEGTRSEAWQGENILQIYNGSVHNRLARADAPEHRLVLKGIYGIGLSCGPANCVTFSARANLLTGDAKYTSESTIAWLCPPKVDYGGHAWKFIMSHLTNLDAFFRGTYDGPGRLS